MQWTLRFGGALLYPFPSRLSYGSVFIPFSFTSCCFTSPVESRRNFLVPFVEVFPLDVLINFFLPDVLIYVWRCHSQVVRLVLLSGSLCTSCIPLSLSYLCRSRIMCQRTRQLLRYYWCIDWLVKTLCNCTRSLLVSRFCFRNVLFWARIKLNVLNLWFIYLFDRHSQICFLGQLFDQILIILDRSSCKLL